MQHVAPNPKHGTQQHQQPEPVPEQTLLASQSVPCVASINSCRTAFQHCRVCYCTTSAGNSTTLWRLIHQQQLSTKVAAQQHSWGGNHNPPYGALISPTGSRGYSLNNFKLDASNGPACHCHNVKQPGRLLSHDHNTLGMPVYRLEA
jgi:hypothetical protein